MVKTLKMSKSLQLPIPLENAVHEDLATRKYFWVLNGIKKIYNIVYIRHRRKIPALTLHVFFQKLFILPNEIPQGPPVR